MTNPTLISTPFATAGGKNIIQESVPLEPNNPTWLTGFPTITSTPVSEGGLPPKRLDFNGVLNAITENTVHQTKGLGYEFDVTYATKIGGYPIHAVLTLTNGDRVQSTVPNNTNDPNVDMVGWVKTNSTSQIFDASGNSLQGINDNLYTSINVFTKRSVGFISLFEFIPDHFHEDLKTLETSGENVGDVSNYVQEALDYASLNHVDVLAPCAYYFVAKPINIPDNIRFVGLSLPYFLTTFNFVGDTVFNIDHALQEQYHVENFRFSGDDNKDYSAIHVGGCRNSVFKNIVLQTDKFTTGIFT